MSVITDRCRVKQLDTMYRDLRAGDPVPKPPKPRPEEEIMRNWGGHSEAPLVSVVCHTYNHGHFVEDALNGFLMQETTFPFEIIIHDDASTDRTQKIIKQYHAKYPAIIRPILQESNIYSQGERPMMYSFPKARGKIIAFCEGDDYWIDCSKLQRQGMFLKNNPDFSVCYTDSVPFREQVIVDADFGGAREDLSADELKKGPAIFTLTACFRNILDSPPELALVRYGDKFLWSRLGRFGKGKFLGEIEPSFYRIHPGGIHSSSSAAEKDMMYFQTYTAMAAYYKRMGEPQLYEYYVSKLKRHVYSSDGVSRELVVLLKPIMQVMRALKRMIRRG